MLSPRRAVRSATISACSVRVEVDQGDPPIGERIERGGQLRMPGGEGAFDLRADQGRGGDPAGERRQEFGEAPGAGEIGEDIRIDDDQGRASSAISRASAARRCAVTISVSSASTR
jgi:hypothetical protein